MPLATLSLMKASASAREMLVCGWAVRVSGIGLALDEATLPGAAVADSQKGGGIVRGIVAIIDGSRNQIFRGGGHNCGGKEPKGCMMKFGEVHGYQRECYCLVVRCLLCELISEVEQWHT